jgi:uncharacterized membrane protein (UPF0127 family)
MQMINARTQDVIVAAVEMADTRESRRRGLLGRDGLAVGSALVITPCFSIHTAFMRFAIDVVFLNRDGVVLRVVSRLAPWRLAIAVGARLVVELPAGALEAHPVLAGDKLYLWAGEGSEQPHAAA